MCLRKDYICQSKGLWLVKFITSNIHWNRKARRLPGGVGVGRWGGGWERNFSIKCIAVLTLDAGLLARSQYPESPATDHLDTGFSWFPCVYKRMLRWFPSFQVDTTCLPCSPPDLNFLVTFFSSSIFVYMWNNHCHRVITHMQLVNIIIMKREGHSDVSELGPVEGHLWKRQWTFGFKKNSLTQRLTNSSLRTVLHFLFPCLRLPLVNVRSRGRWHMEPHNWKLVLCQNILTYKFTLKLTVYFLTAPLQWNMLT